MGGKCRLGLVGYNFRVSLKIVIQKEIKKPLILKRFVSFCSQLIQVHGVKRFSPQFRLNCTFFKNIYGHLVLEKNVEKTYTQNRRFLAILNTLSSKIMSIFGKYTLSTIKLSP